MKKNCFSRLKFNKFLNLNKTIKTLSFIALASTFPFGGETLAAPMINDADKPYTITQTNENDYSYTYETTDSSGNTTTQYYKITLDPEKFSNSSEITWSEVDSYGDRTIEVYLPNNEIKYYQYSYKDNSYPVKDEASGIYILNSGSNGGGAIHNPAAKDLTGDFISNSVINETNAAISGAIYNDDSINSITGNFISNFAESKKEQGQGGAIQNNGSINSIIGNFISNVVISEETIAFGGAILNVDNAAIDSITGNFISNTAVSENEMAFGGAIINANNATIDSITGNFILNYTMGEEVAQGGAIENNYATINNIKGTFISNSAISNNVAEAGAIYNSGTINNIEGEFISNSANYGGALYNDGKIENITGDFNSNSAQYGGAIANYNEINSITGNYTSNFGDGGAVIANYGNINTISGDFVSNGTNIIGGVVANGNNSKIESITGNFLSNYTYGYGGAIDNSGEIGSITGNFTSNYAQWDGGAISNNSLINNINADFSLNTAQYGGSIHNEGEIGSIAGNFNSNSANYGGAIYNYGKIDSLSGNYSSNLSTEFGGAIDNEGEIGSVTGDFNSNSAKYGGGIYNYTKIGNISGDFASNSSQKFGGAVDNDGEADLISGNFVSNKTEGFGGAVSNCGTAKAITGNFISNSAQYGGALSNTGTLGSLSANFIGNHAETSQADEYALGGAIYSASDLNLKADNNNITIKDNYTINQGIKDDNAIYMENSTLNFDLKNNSTISLYDNVRGADGYKVSITGDNSGTFGLYNSMYNADLSLGGATLSTVDNKVYTNFSNPIGLHDSYHFKNITLTDNVKFIGDVDLRNKQMDRFSADSYGDHGANQLSINGLNLITDTLNNESETAIYFSEPGLKNNVVLSDEIRQTTFYSPIYAYNVTYDNQNQYDDKGDGGYLLFHRNGGASSHNNYNQFNPAILTSPTYTAAASLSTMNETYKYAFEHLDAFTQLPLLKRLSEINKNKYALVEPGMQGYSTDFNQNLGSLRPEYNRAGWVRPYTTFETIPLKNGPKVNSINYGTLLGYDGDFKQHRNGIYSIDTYYLGYNGASVKYRNTDSILNGGLVGYTKTFYKNNLWSATTIAAGANNARSQTMYGSENFTSILAGVAQKTGYNFEFKNGKYIIQPMLALNYTFINPFDYTNAAGVKIKSNPTHNLQINPNIRFITNLKNGYQPYASVGMVFNPLHNSEASANGIRLPEMYVKPYVEYSFGLQRNWSKDFTAFFETMIRHAGRNGVALTAGFRWNIGKCEQDVKGKIKEDL